MDKQRYIWLDGQKIYVSEEVYRAYYRPVWREIKQDEVRKEKECSLDAMCENGFEATAKNLFFDELYWALDELTAVERELIDALFFDGKTERDVAAEKGISQNTVNYHKKRILSKLKEILK